MTVSSITVLISLYRNENCKYLEQCLDSLVTQTRAPEQVVIVYDGYIGDKLEAIVSSFYSKLPIDILRLDENVGLGQALNEGLSICKGDYVARLDSDDICYPNRLELQENFIVTNSLDIVGSAATIIDESGVVTGQRNNPLDHQDIVSNLWRNPFIHPSIMFKKTSLESIGNYDGRLRRRQDYELWFRAAKHGLKFGNLQDKLIEYRFGQHTLQKQSPKLAWNQGKIGFIGSMSCKLGVIKSLVCFVPFFRSLLPIGLQVKLTQLMKSFDSRIK